jgi:general secretion pathway protein C
MSYLLHPSGTRDHFLAMSTEALLSPGVEQLLERVSSSRWTPVAVNLVALVLLTSSLAQWTWRLFGPASPPPASVLHPTLAATNENALRDLLAVNLFGQAPSGQNTSANLPATALNLVLTGVMVRGQNSFALISVDGAPETPVAVGDEITAGARLHAVYPDRVVLRRGNAFENLPLKENEGALAPGSIVAGSVPGAGAPIVQNEGGNTYSVVRERLAQQMQTPEFLSQAMMVPNAGGGFLVRSIKPGSLYEKLGLRPGDVIRSVNGQPINNMDEVMRVYQQLGGLERAGDISVDVSRGGKSETLQYQLQ